ncbi:MAG: ATP synthase F1 subunit delta [Deltaproteobacteria bacterium]|nr:ATP synthase F1 subunit delta [Deltaproteobacteria bacterium]
MRADEGTVARRYARAALLFCNENGGHDGFEAGLRVLVTAFKEQPVVETLLVAPLLRKDRKREVVDEVAKQLRLVPAVARFVKVLVDQGRVGYLASILERFVDLLDQQRGRVRAQVRSATVLPESDRRAVASALSVRFGKQVLCSFAEDESLYGGVVARVGNTIIDSSLKGRLERARKRVRSMES